MIFQKIGQKLKLKKLKSNDKKDKINSETKRTKIGKNNIIGKHSLSLTNIISSNYPKKSICYKNITKKILKSFSQSKILKNNKDKKLKKIYEINKYNSILKTSNEMSKKFYIRNREVFKDIGKSNELYSGFIKDPRKIINKILFDYKNMKKYDKEELLFHKNNYERNIEYIENQEKIINAKRIKENLLFNKLKKSNKKTYNKISSFNINQSESISPIPFSINHKSKLKEQTIPSIDDIFESENKLEQKVIESLKNNKKLMIKKIKNNAIKFCNSISHVDFMCRPYEPINEETSKLNLRRNIYYNLPNLERISKLETIIKTGFDEDDFENNGKYIKKFSKEYEVMLDKVHFGFLPKFAKKTGFKNKTLWKYNNLHGKYFGLPI